jgi:hypothetical protein
VSLERARFEMGEIADYEGLRGEFLELVRGVGACSPFLFLFPPRGGVGSCRCMRVKVKGC